MRALPVRIEPFPGETVRSVYRRLAEHNAVPTGELWTAIRHVRPRLPLRTSPELVPGLVEELAALPHGHFRGRPRDRLFVRCVHAQWQHASCDSCAPLPAPVTMCRRCSHGENVEVRGRTGLVCTRHRRWHDAGADASASARHLRAERCLVGTLWERGIGPYTGELELAAEILGHCQASEDAETVTTDHGMALREAYPDAVQLVALLTEPWAEQFMANTRIGHAPVAALIETSVTAVTTRARSALAAVRESFRARDRETVITMNRSARLRHGQSPGLGELGAQIHAIAPRVRATLLRHADARHFLGTRQSDQMREPRPA